MEAREVYLYEKMDGQAVQCQNCAHYCLIKEGQRGICSVRENQGGKLYALNYGKIVAMHIDPIEKKPLYHFLPGTHSLSLATVGCNFSCLNCQNWEISQSPKPQKPILGKEIPAQAVVDMALENHLPSISYTYTEPAIFSEYALDIMKIAKVRGLKNVWVSNGFWSKELLEMISPYLDATNIDLKSLDDDFYKRICQGRLQPVLDTLKKLKEKKIWIEITTLILPGINDQEKSLKAIANFIKNELGTETPWHVSRFFRDVSWQLKDVPDTPVAIVDRARQIGLAAGLKNVHTGNI
jgi:pyruvate formate lyase activating enzyme